MTNESIVLGITGELEVAMNGDDDCNMELGSGRRGWSEDVRDIAAAAHAHWNVRDRMEAEVPSHIRAWMLSIRMMTVTMIY
jgi:hypothetical protein